MAESTDEALAHRVAAGDSDAFGVLYDRYARPVYAMAVHMLGREEAEEATQEVFLRLWDRAGQFDPSRGAFRTWLYAVARHHIVDQLQRRSLHQRVVAVESIEALLANTADPASPDLDHHAWVKESGDAILRALRSLPEEQRRVLLLAYFGGMSQSQIAEHTGCPLGTVKKRARLGLQKLRACLEELAPAERSPSPAPSVE